MTKAVALLCRVVRRRVNKGENLDSVLKGYPKLTREELAQVQSVCRT